jgi:hypothetical protein
MVWSSKKSISSIDQPMRLGCDIAYRRLSALERDNIARSRSHAVASSRDLDPGCLLALFTTSISPNPSAPAFSLPLYSSLLPDDDDTCICTCCLHTYYQSHPNPASSLTPSGAFTDVRNTQDNSHRHPRNAFTNHQTEPQPAAP